MNEYNMYNGGNYFFSYYYYFRNEKGEHSIIASSMYTYTQPHEMKKKKTKN